MNVARPRRGAQETCDCGCKKWKKEVDPSEKATVMQMSTVIDPLTGQEYQTQEAKEIDIEYYKPSKYPLILRKNISRDRHLLGSSDVNAIRDQQETVKKLGSKINEKLLMGGSYVTLPSGVGMELTDEEFKVIRVENPAQKQLIDVITTQADCGQDRIVLETSTYRTRCSSRACRWSTGGRANRPCRRRRNRQRRR